MKITEQMAREYFGYRFEAILEQRENAALVLASAASRDTCGLHTLLLVDGEFCHTNYYGGIMNRSVRQHEYHEEWNENFGIQSTHYLIFTNEDEKMQNVCYFDKEKGTFEKTEFAPVRYDRRRPPLVPMLNKHTGETGFWRVQHIQLQHSQHSVDYRFSLYVRKPDGKYELTLENVSLKEHCAYQEKCR